MTPIVVAILLLVLQAVPKNGGPAETSGARVRDAAAWVQTVRAHTAGRVDPSLVEMATWSRAETIGAVSSLRKLEISDLEQVVVRGLVLHTDIAIHFRMSEGYALPGEGGLMGVFADGQETGTTSRTFHWEVGRALARLLPEVEDNTVVRDWYRASAAWLHEAGEFPELRAHLAGAKEIYDADPVLTLYEGALHEAYAGPFVQAALRERFERRRPDRLSLLASGNVSSAQWNAWYPDRDDPGTPGGAKEELRKAEGLLRRALRLDPALVEARVRLGAVLAMRDEHDEALAELRTALAGEIDPGFEYYARLLLGHEEQRRGSSVAAVQAFQRALVLVPQSKIAMLGLSQIAAAKGDLSDAARFVDAFARVSSGEGGASWSVLGRLHQPSAIEQLETVRRATH